MYPIKLQTSQRNVNIVKFNYDGDLLFSGSAEKESGINVFEPYTGQLLGTYETRTAVKALDIDINSKYVLCVSFDGTIQMFDVATGVSLKWIHYPACKGYHIQFDLSSKKLMIVYEYQLSTRIRILDFDSVIAAQPPKTTQQSKQGLCNNNDIKQLANFPIFFDEGAKCQSFKALWFIDNKSIFMGTKKGEILHFSETGKQLNKAMIHKDSTISSICFSSNFQVLATAAGDGCKIIDPITMETLRFLKQEYPMNTVSISPLFSSATIPKYHVIMAGGIKAIQAAQSKQSGFEVHLCNIMDQHEIGKLSTHFSPVNSVQFFKDGRGYVTSGDDGYVVILRFDQSYFDNPKYE